MTDVVPAELLSDYTPSNDAFDELVGGDGMVRDHWRTMIGALGSLGGSELVQRRNEVRRLLATDGVTYNVYDSAEPTSGPDGGTASALTEPRGGTGGRGSMSAELRRAGRAWSLDPVPMLLGSEQWAGIEADVIERAELLNLILRDLYGPRDLLRRGLIPPELVFGHRGFIRAADQVDRGPSPLFLYGVDLARGVNGDLWAIADLSQTPSGAGYALENRRVISRVFPSLYRDAQVHRLAPFFRALRSAVTAAAPAGVDDPRVVILTPGPLNETYFEHAYLSTQLGYTLVEARDLTVRNGYLWLRSLGGLERVDVVLRRVDSWYCDPLELKSDSRLGVPGLLEACRRGTVRVVNPIGSSVIENPGLAPFLPAIAQHLLGHELRLSAPPTWWCGEPDQRSHVLANLDRLLVKPIAGKQGRNTIVGSTLSLAELDDLRTRIDAAPHAFVGQEMLEFSTVPTLSGSALMPRQAVLRTFAVAHDDSYLVMPGGLTRVAPVDGEKLVTNQGGAINKDTWVLASEPEAQSSFWLHRGPLQAADPAGGLPSRTAENLFWLGRYAERAETAVRVIRVILDRRNDFQTGSSAAGARALHDLLVMLADLTDPGRAFKADPATSPETSPEASPGGSRTDNRGEAILSFLSDADLPGSLAFSIRAMLDCATAARDQLSGDTWLALADLDQALDPLQANPRGLDQDDEQNEAQDALATTMRGLLAFAGLATESMVRDPGWAFMDAGRRLERAISVATMLRSTLVTVRSTAAESLVLESLLVSGESIITYRRRYRSHAQVETLLDLLVLDSDNPRSVLHQLDCLERETAVLPRADGQRFSAEQRLALQLATAVRILDTTAVAKQTGPDDSTNGATDESVRPELRAFLDDLLAQLARLGATIEATHFDHLPESQSMDVGLMNRELWGEVMR